MWEFTFQLEPQAKTPLYRQLYNALINEIKSGNLQEGEKLPGKKSFANHLGISQSTVETAYEMLSAEGYVVAKPRSGFYVNRLEFLENVNNDFALRGFEFWENRSAEKKQCRYSLLSGNIDTTVFPYGTWAKITKSVVYNEKNILSYGEGQGDWQLRLNLAKYLHSFRGVKCNPNQVVIGAGLEYLLPLVCGLTGKNSVYALEDPGYPKTARIIENCGVKTEYLSVDEDGMSIEDLEKSHANVAYITPSHQFPTGVVMPVGRRLKILNWAYKSPCRYIIEDDYDSEFRYVGSPIPALQGMDKMGRVIYVGTFSRSIAPAFRVAYMVLPEPLLEKYNYLYDCYSNTVSRLDQNILNEFIAGGHFSRHLNRVRNVYRQRRDAFVTALKKSPLGSRIQIIGDNAGLHFLLQIDCGLSEKELMQAATDKGICLNGFEDYCYKKISEKPTVILGFADLMKEEAENAVELLCEAWL